MNLSTSALSTPNSNIRKRPRTNVPLFDLACTSALTSVPSNENAMTQTQFFAAPKRVDKALAELDIGLGLGCSTKPTLPLLSSVGRAANLSRRNWKRSWTRCETNKHVRLLSAMLRIMPPVYPVLVRCTKELSWRQRTPASRWMCYVNCNHLIHAPTPQWCRRRWWKLSSSVDSDDIFATGGKGLVIGMNCVLPFFCEAHDFRVW